MLKQGGITVWTEPPNTSELGHAYFIGKLYIKAHEDEAINRSSKAQIFIASLECSKISTSILQKMI